MLAMGTDSRFVDVHLVSFPTAVHCRDKFTVPTALNKLLLWIGLSKDLRACLLGGMRLTYAIHQYRHRSTPG